MKQSSATIKLGGGLWSWVVEVVSEGGLIGENEARALKNHPGGVGSHLRDGGPGRSNRDG